MTLAKITISKEHLARYIWEGMDYKVERPDHGLGASWETILITITGIFFTIP